MRNRLKASFIPDGLPTSWSVERGPYRIELRARLVAVPDDGTYREPNALQLKATCEAHQVTSLIHGFHLAQSAAGASHLVESFVDGSVRKLLAHLERGPHGPEGTNL